MRNAERRGAPHGFGACTNGRMPSLVSLVHPSLLALVGRDTRWHELVCVAKETNEEHYIKLCISNLMLARRFATNHVTQLSDRMNARLS